MKPNSNCIQLDSLEMKDAIDPLMLLGVIPIVRINFSSNDRISFTDFGWITISFQVCYLEMRRKPLNELFPQLCMIALSA